MNKLAKNMQFNRGGKLNWICGFYAVNGHHCLNDETNRCYVCNKIITAQFNSGEGCGICGDGGHSAFACPNQSQSTKQER